MVIVQGDNEPKPPKPQGGGNSPSVDYGKMYADEIRREKKAKKEKITMPRKIAIFQSIVLIGFIIFGICAIANDKNDNERWMIVSILFVVLAGQIFNITALWIDPIHKTASWLALYLERKRLEEKKKIENLTAKK